MQSNKVWSVNNVLILQRRIIYQALIIRLLVAGIPSGVHVLLSSFLIASWIRGILILIFVRKELWIYLIADPIKQSN